MHFGELKSDVKEPALHAVQGELALIVCPGDREGPCSGANESVACAVSDVGGAAVALEGRRRRYRPWSCC